MISSTSAQISTSAAILKNALPSYLGFLFYLHLPAISTLGFSVICSALVLLLLGIYITYRYFQINRQLLQKYVTLEVKPPSVSLQSAFSTQKLFSILHALDYDKPFLEKFFNVKKRLSYELISTREDGIRYVLYVPEKEVPIITKNLQAYLTGVSITQIHDYLPQTIDELEKKEYLLTECTLKNSFVLPLQEQNMLKDVDPIAYITGHMTKLNPQELVAIQIVTTPVTPATHSRVTTFISKLHHRNIAGREIVSLVKIDSVDIFIKILQTLFSYMGTVLLFFLEAIGEFIWSFNESYQNKVKQSAYANNQYNHQPKHDITELSPKQREMQEIVEKKINQNLFEITFRLCIVGSNKESIQDRKNGIISSFESFRNPGYQAITEKRGVPRFLGTHKIIKKFNYFKVKQRLFSLSSNPILSTSELSSLYHFPYSSTTQTEDMNTIKTPALPAPLSLKNANGSLDIVFAHNIHGGLITPIGLTLDERRRHMYILGATGMGKSTLILHMIHHDMMHGRGMAIIDPHGDLAKTVIGTVPESRIEDVVYVNPTDRKFPIGLNIFDIPDGLTEDEMDQEKDLVVSTIISVFHKLFSDQYVKHRMEHILRNTILTALEQENPTFLTIKKLLTDTKFRNAAKKNVIDEMVLDFWKHEFESLTISDKTNVIAPITNKLGVFLTNKTVRFMITQKKSTINFDEIMNANKILVCNFSKGEIGEDMSSFLGNLIIAKIQLAAMRRSRTAIEERNDFFLYVDEFQNFATHSFAQILSEARKYRLGAVLAHQNISQIEDQGLRDTIIGNSGTVIIFRTAIPKDEETLLSYLGSHVQKGQLGNLPTFTFYIKINAEVPQDTFTGKVELFLNKPNKTREQKAIEYSQKKYGTPIHLLKPKVTKKETNSKNKPSKTNTNDDEDRASI